MEEVRELRKQRRPLKTINSERETKRCGGSDGANGPTLHILIKATKLLISCILKHKIRI